MKIVITKYSKQFCRPCAALSNYLSQIDLAEHGAELHEIDIADLTDDQLEALGITSVPVMTYQRNGVEVIDRTIGLISPEEIIENIKLSKVVR